MVESVSKALCLLVLKALLTENSNFCFLLFAFGIFRLNCATFTVDQIVLGRLSSGASPMVPIRRVRRRYEQCATEATRSDW